MLNGLENVSYLSSDEDEMTFLDLMRVTVDSRQASTTKVEKKRRKTINRDCIAANELLMHDYFNEDCLYTDEQFEDRYRIGRNLMLRIANDLSARYKFFQLRYDARGRRGFTTLQKCTAAMRQLGYGIAADANDEYLKMSERTALECVYLFCEYVIQVYGKYICETRQRVMWRSCMLHILLNMVCQECWVVSIVRTGNGNCPNAWRGQFTRGDHDGPNVILEGVALHDLWFWHAFFGMSGSCNDLNVLAMSPLLNDISEGKAPDMSYVVNENEYKFGYYLGDGIYPAHATFVKAFSYPKDDKMNLFKAVQESARKDVERAFGVLKSRWHILKHPARSWDKAKLTKVMTACVIIHNMLIEESGRASCTYNPEDDLNPTPQIDITSDEYITRILEITNSETHHTLREDLAEHVWQNRDA